MYDLVIFLSTKNPNHASDARLQILGKFSEIQFTTSFTIFDYKANSDWEKFQSDFKARFDSIKTGFRIRGTIRQGFKIKPFKEKISKILNVSDKDIIAGNVPGDEDFVINVKEETVGLFNILKMYHEHHGNPDYLFRLSLGDEPSSSKSENYQKYGSQNTFSEIFKHSNSTFAFFGHHEGYLGINTSTGDEKLKKLEKLFQDVVAL